ncbi:hypothetical protein ABZS77_26840 [Micromonospora sp. NPDC005298]|uniref:hypothetical protein n=1 Tax=Micromonospora sp. NPDC005298 TaxID=3156873 RepID=UPI0033AD40C5
MDRLVFLVDRRDSPRLLVCSVRYFTRRAMGLAVPWPAWLSLAPGADPACGRRRATRPRAAE